MREFLANLLIRQEKLPRREHFWQLAFAYRRYPEWSIPGTSLH